MSGGRASISVICATREPASLVQRIMETVRPHVDEVLIAADERCSPESLADYSVAADRLLTFAWAGANRVRPWLAEQARGDWLLMIDGDELPSLSLLGALPDLTSTRSVAQWCFPRRWLFARSDSYLAADPWDSERLPRLARNDDRLFFPGTKHTGLRPEPPFDIHDAPIYHFALLLQDLGQRERKVAQYDSERPGMLWRDGRPYNEAFYLPDASVALAQVECPADRLVLREMLSSGKQPPSLRPEARVEGHASVEAQRRSWLGAQQGRDRTSGRIEIIRTPATMATGTSAMARLKIENTGETPWHWRMELQPRAEISYRWHDRSGRLLLAGEPVAPTRRVAPGETSLMELRFFAPLDVYDATLSFCLVHDNEVVGSTDPERFSLRPPPLTDDDLQARSIPLTEAVRARRECSMFDGLHEFVQRACTEYVLSDAERAALARVGPMGRAVTFGESPELDAVIPLITEAGTRVERFVVGAPLADACRSSESVSPTCRRISVVYTNAAEHSSHTYDVDSTVFARTGGELLLLFAQASPQPDVSILPLLRKLNLQNTPFVLLNAWRDSELEVLRLWESSGDAAVHGIVPGRLGLATGTVCASCH